MLSGWCPLGWVLGSGGWPGLPGPTARAMPWTAAHRRWEAPRRQRSGRRRSGCKPAAVILRISARQAAPGCVHPVNSGLHGPRRSHYLGCRVVMRAHGQYRQPRCLRGNAGGGSPIGQADLPAADHELPSPAMPAPVALHRRSISTCLTRCVWTDGAGRVTDEKHRSASQPLAGQVHHGLQKRFGVADQARHQRG